MTRATQRTETRYAATRSPRHDVPRQRVRPLLGRPWRRVLALAAVLLIAAPAVAGANPVDDKRAEAKRIAAERERLTTQAELLNERANRAADEMATLESQLGASQQRLDQQNVAVDGLRKRLAVFALTSYMRGGGTGGLEAMLADDGANQAGLRRGYAPAVLGDQTDLLDQLRASQQDIDASTKDIDAKRARQSQLLASIARDKAGVEANRKKLAQLAQKVDQELDAAIKEEQAKAAAAAEAAAAARQRAELKRQADAAAAAAARERAARVQQAAVRTNSAVASPGRGPSASAGGAAAAASIPIPPTSAAAGVAVAEALRQLGKPYVFGTNGPDTFDCSGLTQWAWAKAGVPMGHYTVTQFHSFPQVPVDQLQPGDLVFFNVDLGHMGMYIGNGNIVQAPRTGDVVKVSPLSGRNLVGAVRPG